MTIKADVVVREKREKNLIIGSTRARSGRASRESNEKRKERKKKEKPRSWNRKDVNLLKRKRM